MKKSPLVNSPILPQLRVGLVLPEENQESADHGIKLLGASANDYLPHGKKLLGKDDHDLKKHGHKKLISEDVHNKKSHGKSKNKHHTNEKKTSEHGA